MLLLAPRLQKDSVFTEITQAGDGPNRYLVDQNGRVIYYAQHINPVFVDFVRTNHYTDMDKLFRADSNQAFPVGSLELKSSWKIVIPGEDVSDYFTTNALVEQLVSTKDPNGDTIFVIDPTVKPKPQRVALLGLHVVGVVVGHSEFIWATFEHKDLAPNLDKIGKDPKAPVAVDNDPSHKYLLDLFVLTIN